MLIDTHCHINLRAFRDDGAETLQRALDAQVSVINVGTQIDTSRQAVALLNQFPENVYAVIGLHPVHTYKHQFIDDNEINFQTREEGFDYDMYKLLAENSRVVGIGECGLDYFRLPEDTDHADIKQKQLTAFQLQIKLAEEMDKVLCVHCRPSSGTNDAYEEMVELMGAAKQRNSQFRFEIHCYTGDVAIAQKFIELGGYIGVNGIITFDKTDRSQQVVERIPLESIILETDAPYLAPVPMRGKRNEPAFVEHTARKIAEWKKVSYEHVAEITTQNAKQLFKI